jgi:hypothetical protein
VRPVLVLVVCALLPCACRQTVSCHVDAHGQCHEWRGASLSTRREIEQAVCKKSDERYAMGACPRERSVGECSFAGNQSTIWYEGSSLDRTAAARICSDSGGVWIAR